MRVQLTQVHIVSRGKRSSYSTMEAALGSVRWRLLWSILLDSVERQALEVATAIFLEPSPGK